MEEAEHLTLAEVKQGRAAAIRQGITFGRAQAEAIRRVAENTVAVAERITRYLETRGRNFREVEVQEPAPERQTQAQCDFDPRS